MLFQRELIWNRQMASLLCVSFHDISKCHSSWISFHISYRQMTFLHSFMLFQRELIWNRQMASLLCVSFHDLSKCHSSWISFHISNRQMTFLNSFMLFQRELLRNRQMASLLCVSFHDRLFIEELKHFSIHTTENPFASWYCDRASS